MPRLKCALAAMAIIAIAFLLIIYLLGAYDLRLNALYQEDADELILCEQGVNTMITAADCYLRVLIPANRSAATAFLVVNPVWLLMLLYGSAGALSGGFFYLLVLYRPNLVGVKRDQVSKELSAELFLLRIVISAVAGSLSFWLVAGGLTVVSAFAEIDSQTGYQWALIVPFAAGLFLSTFLERVHDVIKKKGE